VIAATFFEYTLYTLRIAESFQMWKAFVFTFMTTNKNSVFISLEEVLNAIKMMFPSKKKKGDQLKLKMVVISYANK
jgi:hypothetical protein